MVLPPVPMTRMEPSDSPEEQRDGVSAADPVDYTASFGSCPAPPTLRRMTREGTTSRSGGAAAWQDTASIYARVHQLARAGISREELVTELIELWSDRADGPLTVFQHGSATYLFEVASGTTSDRTIACVGVPPRAVADRQSSYQAGFPLKQSRRPVDRGHLMPHSGGGLFGPNIFRQDRALNRGLSLDGRRFRQAERNAVATQSMYFAALRYADTTDYPAVVETGPITAEGVITRAYRNRLDVAAVAAYPPPTDDGLAISAALDTLTSAQLGDIGEEVVRSHLEDSGAPIIAVGDSHLPRNDGRQDLDLVAVIDGELTVVEVKTRYLSGIAGTRTRAGNLRRPKLSTRGPARQSSADYNATRLTSIVDVDGIAAVRVYVVDLQAAFLQWFPVNDAGRLQAPPEGPETCAAYLPEAIETIRAAGRL